MHITTESIRINNVRQNLMTLSTDGANPILLIIHGGAGLPDRRLVRQYNAPLAECYTVVCWDQRGAGFSEIRAPLNLNLMLSDLKAVVLYLRKKYGQNKLYIAGHSWGSYLGLWFAARYPEYVEYYIGTGQEISSIEDEIDRYRFVREQARARNDRRVLRMLERFGEPEGYRYAVAERVRSMNDSVINEVDKIHDAIRNDSKIAFHDSYDNRPETCCN